MRKIFLIYGCYLALLAALAGYYTAARISTAYATQARLESLARDLPPLIPLIRSGDLVAANRCVLLVESVLVDLPSLRGDDAKRMESQLSPILAGCKRVAESAAMVQPET